MKKHITKIPKKYDKINNLDLRSDLENSNLWDTYLHTAGLIHTSPKTWAIDCRLSDGTGVLTYLYESKDEYKEDCKLLGLVRKKPTIKYFSIRTIKAKSKTKARECVEMGYFDESNPLSDIIATKQQLKKLLND